MAEITRPIWAGAATLSEISVRLRPTSTMSRSTRTVFLCTGTVTTPRNAAVYLATRGKGIRPNERTFAPAPRPFASDRRRHGTASGTIERRQSRLTMPAVLRTSTSFAKSTPVRRKSLAAAPVITRSETFGW